MARQLDVHARPPAYLDENGEERSYTVLGTVLLVLLIIVVALVFWRSCSSDRSSDDARGAGGVISDVPALDAVEGGVAIWVKPGEDVERILSRNGLGDASYTDLGEGTYVIAIGEQDAEAIVERLKEDDSLFDAGFLFAEDDARPAE